MPWRWSGHVKGGLGYVAILAACILSALSGSAVADAAALSALLVPMMVQAGHSKSLSGGLIAASGVIGPVIPPSIGFVIFGVVGGVSITKLFLAGLVPGILIGLGLAFAWWWEVRKETIVSPPKKSAGEIGPRSARGRLGSDAALHHHLRPEVRRLHARPRRPWWRRCTR